MPYLSPPTLTAAEQRALLYDAAGHVHARPGMVSAMKGKELSRGMVGPRLPFQATPVVTRMPTSSMPVRGAYPPPRWAVVILRDVVSLRSVFPAWSKVWPMAASFLTAGKRLRGAF